MIDRSTGCTVWQKVLIIVLAVVATASATLARSAEPAGRIAWTTSRISGSPDAPPPYITERVFPKLHFTHPLCLCISPSGDRWFVVEQGGKIFSFPTGGDVQQPDLFLDIPQEIKTMGQTSRPAKMGDTYGLVFHPKFAENHYCYVCYVLNDKEEGKTLPDGTRVSRFTVSQLDPPRVDPASEKILLTWPAGGHNGGDLHFGRDGLLYISTGDGAGPSPPDPLNTGQDISDLLSSILRIDVDHAQGDRPYSIPADNPFVKTKNARGEVWAFGLRNPWRMSFDRQTGDLWVGDVGWELWEMIYRIERGGNYGWSITEGPQPVHADAKLGPAPITPPMLSFSHTEAASITGGYVYRGQRLPDLAGAYICGDWETRRVWATKFDLSKPPGKGVVWHKELAAAGPRIVAFGEDQQGELLILDYDLGSLHQLTSNTAPAANKNFPRLLSQTGLFDMQPTEAPSRELHPLPGVERFEIRVPMWSDGALAERFIAIPGAASAVIFDLPQEIEGSMFHQQMSLPADSVLVKTLSLPHGESADKPDPQRVETQVLHYDGRNWRGYTYQWSADQRDATLVEAAGADAEISLRENSTPATGAALKRDWHFASRSECVICHNPWSEGRLAFNDAQLPPQEIDRLRAAGILRAPRAEEIRTRRKPNEPAKPKLQLACATDDRASLELRARSYLHVNCAHCHQFGGGGTALIALRGDTPLDKTLAVDAMPTQGNFGIEGARIIAPGDPWRSTLFYRLAKTGSGHMPHLGAVEVDRQGLQLLHDWICQLDAKVKPNEPIDWQALASQDADSRQKRIAELIGTIPAALSLAVALDRQIDDPRLSQPLREQLVAAGAGHADPLIRDLFERFLPPQRRVKRLGSKFDVAKLLAAPGDASRGKELFFAATLNCKNCHRIGVQGGLVGPELTQIGKKYNRAQILENIVDPSKTIEPKYVTYLVQTSDGQSLSGVLVEKSDAAVTLRDAQDKLHSIPAAEVERLLPQPRSLMPEQLLRDLTAGQAADLLEYLCSLK